MTELPVVHDAQELRAFVQERPDALLRLHLRAPTEEDYEELTQLDDTLASICELVCEGAALSWASDQPHAVSFFSSRWLSNIRAVTFEGGTIDGVFETTHVVDCLAQNTALEYCSSFTVKRCEINHDAWTSLVLGAWWSGLTHLCVDQPGLDDRTIDPVLSWTPLPAATHVEIHSDALTDWGVETRVALVKWAPTLEWLDIEGALLTSRAWEHIVACESLPAEIRSVYWERAQEADDSWESRFGALRSQLHLGLEQPHQRGSLVERLQQFYTEDSARYREVVIPYLEGLEDVTWPHPFWAEYRGQMLPFERIVRLLPFASLGLHIPAYDETFDVDWKAIAAAPELAHVCAVFLGGDHEIDGEDLHHVVGGKYGAGVTSWGFDDPRDEADVAEEIEELGLDVLEASVFVAQAFGRRP